MGIDKETTPNYFSMWINKGILKKCEEHHKEEIGDKEHKEKPQIIIDEDMFGTLNTEEYYFDETDDSIYYCGSDLEGNYFSFSIPLSDTILIDILTHSIKKLNKLKVALESLK